MFIHLNLNTASKEEILLIPGVGNRMLHEFEEYRPYKALALFHREIDKYVDDKELARLNSTCSTDQPEHRQRCRYPVHSRHGAADAARVQRIPTVQDDGQFRREIGKYVDKKEVARLERYVTLN